VFWEANPSRVDRRSRPAIFRRLRDPAYGGGPNAPVAELVDALDSKSKIHSPAFSFLIDFSASYVYYEIETTLTHVLHKIAFLSDLADGVHDG
jgi:hypothetical protein